MNRLTHRYVGGVAWASIYKVSACGENECKGPIIDRLAAYEDTGLEPEEIKEVQEAMAPIPFGRFRDIMEAERAGRLVLPSEPNAPLTLEELREMDGEPVWVVSRDGRNESCWMLVDVEYELCREAHGGMAVFENNGKTWLAYRRKPEEGV